MARPLLNRLLRLRLWLGDRLRPGETQVTLFWAGLIGACSGLAAVAFRVAATGVQWLQTGSTESLVATATALPPGWRVAVPALGGLAAGLVLHFGSRFTRGRRSDYMEAIALSDGVVRSRPSAVRIVSSLFSISSGASLGREGPLVQLSAVVASVLGRFANFPRPRLRLMVACGAAAGIASACNAPIGGALFVAEIVLGSIAMSTFGPLILSSVMATVTARMFLGGSPQLQVQTFHLVTHAELLPYLVLGLTAGALARPFLGLLELAATLFQRWSVPIFVRLSAGGLGVGLLSLGVPAVWGNGREALAEILATDVVWTSLLLLLVFKLAATALSIGSGAVGGVFTPTLLVGGVIGALVGAPLHALAPGLTAPASAYALVGMGAFLAATTRAPLMAILLVFEMTLDYDIVLPLMLACVTAHAAARAVSSRSIYERVLRGRAAVAAVSLEAVQARDLMRPDPVRVLDAARFPEIVQKFVRNRHHNLYVVGTGGEFRGVIPLHEVKPFLYDAELAQLAIAQDLLREEFPTVQPESSLGETLEQFTRHGVERLPVVERQTRRLVGSISKTDLLLALAPGTDRGG